jgi:hypothetical protein
LLSHVSYAGLCKNCGRCEKVCPQHLPVPALLKDVSKEMEKMMRIIVPLLKGGLWCMGKIKYVGQAISRH